MIGDFRRRMPSWRACTQCGSANAPQLRELADHIRTTFHANGSTVALQQLIVNALDESKALLRPDETATVDRALVIVRDQPFLRLLEAAQSGDGHRIVIEAVDTGSLAISPTSADSDDTLQRAAIKAALAVLKYATEAHANRTVTESTRAAAREALFTYLAENGEGGYASRKGVLGASWGIEPLASLGASFSSGYVNSEQDCLACRCRHDDCRTNQADRRLVQLRLSVSPPSERHQRGIWAAVL